MSLVAQRHIFPTAEGVRDLFLIKAALRKYSKVTLKKANDVKVKEKKQK